MALSLCLAHVFPDFITRYSLAERCLTCVPLGHGNLRARLELPGNRSQPYFLTIRSEHLLGPWELGSPSAAGSQGSRGTVWRGWSPQSLPIM